MLPFFSVFLPGRAGWKLPPEAPSLFFMKIPATGQGAVNAVLTPSIMKWLSVQALCEETLSVVFIRCGWEAAPQLNWLSMQLLFV